MEAEQNNGNITSKDLQAQEGNASGKNAADIHITGGETPPTPHTAEAEVNKGGKESGVPFGKFKDAEALLRAYESLEAEFTKKCQRLARLEEESTSGKDNVKPEPPQTDYSDSGFIEKNILTNKVIVDRVISEYLKELSKTAAPRTIDGVNGRIPIVPTARPRTIAEAGMLAQRMIKGQ